VGNGIKSSDVVRPLSNKTNYFFKTKTALFKDYQIINSRPQKYVL